MNTFAEIFEQLNNTRRTRADGTQCWLYSDLNNLYNIHPGKLRTIQSQVFSALFENRAAYNAAARQYPNNERPMIPFFHDHITTVYHDYDITTGPYPQHIKNGHDLEMSRYACWALLAAQPGISTTFGETYFLYPDAGPERLAALTREFMRLPLRQNLKKKNKKREQLKKETEDAKRAVERIADGFLPVYDFADVVRADGFLSGIGKCENVYGVVRFFYRETVKKIKTRFGMSTAKLCRFDPFALCLLAAELGFSLSPQFGFVFVDEAQDISPAEYAVLRTVNGRAAFNVFGDLKQNMTPYRGIKSWDEIGCKVYNLNLNYRNTNQIVEYVSGNLGIDMRAIGADGSEVERIDERSATKYLSDKNGLRAVITSESGYGKYLRKSYNSVRDTGRISKSKINILTVYESKGLEFTAVAVADSDMSDNEKYIAYTRALKYLACIT